MERKAIAREQVEAFMDFMKEQHDLDDAKIAKIVAAAQKNGKNYVTWAWIISVLLIITSAMVGFVGSTIVTDLREFRVKQADVRERLHALEILYKQHAEAK